MSGKTAKSDMMGFLSLLDIGSRYHDDPFSAGGWLLLQYSPAQSQKTVLSDEAPIMLQSMNGGLAAVSATYGRPCVLVTIN